MNKITEPTWIIHQVFDENKIAFHTHGLNKYNSLELELNLPVKLDVGSQIINQIGLAIANGKSFEDGDFDETVLGCKIAFKKAICVFGEKKMVLRIILPDENWKFPWDIGCNKIYKNQI